ncbi:MULTISPECIES: transporter substrate-binding domain-containing protein [unclassified Pseudoalteromonas]|uniref:substrate-binding periplasmic protein n=1 Tax=unclassified Pseudoalteromonas TaxID=194690 RepID=UPI001108B248|nr:MULTISPECIES: transporter substrate-binding domain-containing protein [unclassified Pseudoalteromonas]TMN84756.1 amino acid ABC transporter substrate-binding protein [Pseudoalteromonas sp. S410]TMN91027.1 amino acid ABC transporter substrate-binding protein [Pseudoalteromonas sp. S408]TMN97906.1 amino acid ABC transporter substrate-binding protein [Pseudoalteromonas sp. S407]TMO01296.1 amino acid ABC transporter substrate-binding protein [Pseudoalteromonas sp. S409]TMO06778.1 amino acid ABC
MKILLFITLFTFSAFNAWGCTKTLTVATNESYWPPYVILKNNTLGGTEIDVLNAIFEGSPYCLNFSVLPNSLRAFEELKQGRVDLIFAASKTTERAEYAHFTLPYRVEKMLLYKHADSPNVHSINQLFSQSLTVGVNRGSVFGEAFEQLRLQYAEQVVLTSESKKRFGMLNKQRINYLLDDSLVAQHFTKQYSNIMPAALVKPINVNNVHFMLSKKTVTTDDIAVINRLIKNNKAVIERIYKPY